MSWKIEKESGDIVVYGFEKGIDSSPHTGIGDMKNLNISSMNGEVMMNYARVRQTTTLFSGTSATASTSNTIIGSASILRGNWILISSSSITNLNNGSYYYVKLNTAGTINLSADYEGTLKNDMGTTGVASFSVVPMGQPIAYTTDYNLDAIGGTLSYYVLDATGLVWKSPPGAENASSPLGTWSLIDYTPVTNANGLSGIFAYKGYIHVVSGSIYWKLTTAAGLGHGNAWAAMNGTSGIVDGINHYSLAGHDSGDGTIYICDGGQVDTLAAIPGVGYDPSGTNLVNYTFSLGALKLPTVETATKLAEISTGSGTQLLIGGIGNVLYPWDKISPFYGGLIFLPENYTQQLISVNNLVYIFCGSKGNVYVTNGSSASPVITIPDYIANSTGGNQDPYFIWGGAMYLRGRIWFSVTAPNCGGIWSFIPTINYYVQDDVGASLRLENQNSYGTYAGQAVLLFAPQLTTSQNVNGPQYWAAYDDGTGGASAVAPYGIDFSDTNPSGVSTGMGVIETDLIPTGTILKKVSFRQIEYKLATPLVAGELITMNYRLNLTSAWVSCGSVITESTNLLSGYFVASFEKTQWLQLQVLFTSTNTTPSFCRLTEVRIR